MLEEVGFMDVELVAKVDILQGTQGEERARSFGTKGATIRPQRP